jgi:hypothetical protein
MKSLRFSNLRPLILALFVLSCSTTATIYTKDGSTHEGYIKRSNESFVYVLGCRNVEKREGGVLKEVELHCTSDEKAEARQIISYSDDGKMKVVELDICDDGTVDKKLTYRIFKPGSAVKLKKFGDKKAGETMSLETLKDTPCYPQPAPIPRADIVDIDHPGNLHAFIAAPVAVAAWIYVIWAIGRHVNNCGHEYGCRTEVGFKAMLHGALVASPATVISVFGLDHWLKSRGAAAAPDTAKTGPRMFTDGERLYYGLGVAWSW